MNEPPYPPPKKPAPPPPPDDWSSIGHEEPGAGERVRLALVELLTAVRAWLPFVAPRSRWREIITILITVLIVLLGALDRLPGVSFSGLLPGQRGAEPLRKTDTRRYFQDYQYEVVAAFDAELPKYGVPLTVGVAIAVQEGGLAYPFPPGDGGASCGPLQIYTYTPGGTPIHPPPPGADCHYWDDITRAITEIGPRWQVKFQGCGGLTAYYADPAGFIETCAPQMQGSIGWNRTLAARNLGAAGAIVEGYLRETLARQGRPATGVAWGDIAAVAAGVEETAVRNAWQSQCLRALARGELCPVP